MKKSRLSEPQIIAVLKEGESGVPLKDLLRKHNITAPTFYRWKSKYSGMEVNDMKRMKDLEAENTHLKRLLAERDLEIDAVKTVLKKKW